jgi:hypothetical protein
MGFVWVCLGILVLFLALGGCSGHVHGYHDILGWSTMSVSAGIEC